MLEVSPSNPEDQSTIGQVMIKRLMTPEEAIAQLNQASNLLTTEN